MNYEEQRFIKERVRMDVVAGEKLYGLNETSELLMRKCVDKMNPDLVRCGGITGYMEVLAVADVCHIPVSSHAYPYFSVPCIAAAFAGEMAEIIPTWDQGVFAEDFAVINGLHKLNQSPGFGCELSEKALHEWCVSKSVFMNHMF